MFLQAIDNAIMVFIMCREPWELSVTVKHCTYLTTNHLGLPHLGALPAVVGSKRHPQRVLQNSLSVRKHNVNIDCPVPLFYNI
jgi:hypothetical protein